MKAISKKQFENACKKVLSGGKSKYVMTSEVYPFYWVRSKGHHKLMGNLPQFSKFLRNTGRCGRASDLYLVCKINPNYKIEPTKSELEKKAKSEAKKLVEKKAKAKEKRDKAKQDRLLYAQSFGLTLNELTLKEAELKAINDVRMQEYEVKRDALLEQFEGKNEMWKVINKVLFARILEKANIFPKLLTLKNTL